MPENNNRLPDFEELTPERMITAIEEAMREPFSGLASPLPSYINRVYEFQAMNGERFIAKFYRPGRWTREAIRDEHRFVIDCAEAEIPVISPMVLPSGDTLAETEGIFFAVYPKRFGRELELHNDENWIRLGSLIARIHNEGAAASSENRLFLHPEKTTANDIATILDGGFVSKRLEDSFKRVCDEILEIITPLFTEEIEFIRIHGDCHRGNILERPGEGIMIIDFDDMMTGPPVQDMWLLLPGHITSCQYEMDLLVEGYEQFRDFDDNMIKLIEPLRAMRIIYFLAWCSRQIDDFKFKNNFPDWGSDMFWRTEIGDLETQLKIIRECDAVINRRALPYAQGRILTDH